MKTKPVHADAQIALYRLLDIGCHSAGAGHGELDLLPLDDEEIDEAKAEEDTALHGIADLDFEESDDKDGDVQELKGNVLVYFC